MATAAFNLTFDNTSDATYRAWVNVLHTQITAMGWVQTADTGQFNLSTGVRSSTAGTNYIVYSTNDALAPLYLKVEYVSGSAALPGLAVTLGYATDGAGSITGTQTSGRWGVASSTASDTTPRTCIISGSPARLSMAINMNATTLANTLVLVVERAKSAAGADVATGALLYFGTGTTANAISFAGTSKPKGWLYLPSSGGVPAIEFGLPCILTNNAAGNNTFGGITGAAVPIPLAGSAQNPGLGMVACLTSEYPARDTTTVLAMYDGNNHTYYAIGPNYTSVAGVGGTLVAGSALLLRYD